MTNQPYKRQYRQLDDETKQKISASSRNKPKSEEHKERLEPLMDVEAGGRYDIPDFHLFRIIHDRFRYCFDVVRRKEKVAQLRFGFYTEDADDSEKYVFLKIMNAVLYDQALLKQVLTVPDFFGLTINNFTALDVAVDTPVNVPSLIKKMMRDKSITTIINGKAIKDRKAILPEIFYEYSTSLDRLRNPTITIKQKKAIANKNEGVTVQAYNKRAEILNHSGKQYVLYIPKCQRVTRTNRNGLP